MLQTSRALTGHADVGRCRDEAVPRVIGGIADQEHQPPAHALGQRQRRPGQGTADALPLPRGIDRQRPQQQRRPGVEPDRPVADRAHQRAARACHVAELGQGGDAVAVAVGGLGVAIRAEHPVQESLDLRPVVGAFGRDDKHMAVPDGATVEAVTQAGEPLRRAGQRAAGRVTHGQVCRRRRRRVAGAAKVAAWNMAQAHIRWAGPVNSRDRPRRESDPAGVGPDCRP